MIVIAYNQNQGNDKKATQDGCDLSGYILIGNRKWDKMI